jgi:hypothetical protein
VTLAGDRRPRSGADQEHTVVPAGRAFPPPSSADFDLGASRVPEIGLTAGLGRSRAAM